MSEEEEYEKINNKFLIACGMSPPSKHETSMTEVDSEYEQTNNKFKNATGTA